MILLGALNEELMITEEDKQQLDNLGISEAVFEKQLSNFKEGIAPLELLDPASLDNGISSYNEEEVDERLKLYERFKDSLDIIKFVPASGAATRMFKCLFQGLNELENQQTLNANARDFLDQLEEYPFYHLLDQHFQDQGRDLEEMLRSGEHEPILEAVLDKSGLNYGSLPKALIEFHTEGGESRTSLEEHFLELIRYGNSDGIGRLHFTVSEEHLDAVKAKCLELTKKYKKEIDVKLEFSVQDASTNTVAVYEDNTPVRLASGELMFRPGGHGALLKNLNVIRAQLIFIKNIDNVCTDKWAEVNVRYKELLAGRLLEMRENIHSLLNGLVHESGRKKASDLIFKRWGIKVETEQEIKGILDRPLRVCGMVKNTGAPGGGPFWVKESDGSRSAQIVESSQVDMNDPDQKAIWMSATHFNPVDIACWVEDHSGVKFDLMQYRDDSTGFISNKSYEGKEIKAQELPGLWNGSMSGWITEFVEVPLETFNPVKTVLDLQNEGHKS